MKTKTNALHVSSHSNVTDALRVLRKLEHGIIVNRNNKWVVAKTKSGGRVVLD